MAYGDLIRKMRKSHGMTLTQFAEKVGISKSHIQRLENEFSNKGKSKLCPPISMLQQICVRTEYDFRTFLEEAGYIDPVEVPKLSPLQKVCGELTPDQYAVVLKYVLSLKGMD